MQYTNPLTWFRRAARLGALFALLVVVVGAWVRLTDAGLGCPDWPGCYGHVHPSQVAARVADANAAYPARPFEYQKAMHEMVHRYIAGALGLLILGLAIFSVWNRRDAAQPRILPLALVGIVGLQAALGAFTVTMLLTPLVVTLHLAGGLTTMGVLWWLSLSPARRDVKAAERPVRRLALVAFTVLACQILLGGWTSSNYAAVSCPDFPTCQGALWPPTDFSAAFALSHGPGVDYAGGVLQQPARTAIHVAHRIGALVAGTLLLLLAFSAFRRAQNGAVRAAALGVAAAVVLQWLIGMSLVWQGFPLWLGTGHNAGAALLLLATLTLLRQLWPAASAIRFSSPDGRRSLSRPPR